MKYDLEERCAKFGEDIINFCRGIKSNDLTRSLIIQLIRSATSVGANYMEANQASSKKDFKNKIRICQKEANESKHWLRMLSVAAPGEKDICRKYWKEAHELTLIFAKISNSCK
jgi:four helix bundle protein